MTKLPLGQMMRRTLEVCEIFFFPRADFYLVKMQSVNVIYLRFLFAPVKHPAQSPPLSFEFPRKVAFFGALLLPLFDKHKKIIDTWQCARLEKFPRQRGYKVQLQGNLYSLSPEFKCYAKTKTREQLKSAGIKFREECPKYAIIDSIPNTEEAKKAVGLYFLKDCTCRLSFCFLLVWLQSSCSAHC
jgi:hypothetical protein